LRAEDFDDFFAPLLELERALDFFAPDLEPDLDFELFDELFFVAGDLAIADILSFPSKKGTGIASPAMVKKPPSDRLRLIARKLSRSLSTDFFDSTTPKLLFSEWRAILIVEVARPWREQMTLGTILLIILILLLIGAIPNWGYSRGWGYGPSGVLGVILIIVIILLLTGRL
jgi:hypothetical protein